MQVRVRALRHQAQVYLQRVHLQRYRQRSLRMSSDDPETDEQMNAVVEDEGNFLKFLFYARTHLSAMRYIASTACSMGGREDDLRGVCIRWSRASV